MSNIILPLGISFKTWSDQIRQDLPTISFPIADSVNNWKSWAAQVVNDNALSKVPMPTDLAFPRNEDWKIWASYFVDSVDDLINT